MRVGLLPVALMATAILAVAGCATATVGTPFNAQNTAQLRVGVSTATEARSLLGEPYQVQTGANGEQLYIWQFVQSHARSGFASMNVQTNTQQAALVFGRDGRLLRVHNLINVPSPIVPEPAQPEPTSSTAGIKQTQEQQLDELSRTPGLSYEEYQRRYRIITGQR